MSKELDEFINICIQLGKSGLTASQAMGNFRKNTEYHKLFSNMINFANTNKKVLIEDYTRQAIL